MGRHRGSDVPATPRQRLASELLGVAIGVGMIAAVWAIAVDSAPQVHADEVPQAPEAVEPTRSVTPAGGPLDRIFYFDDVVPYDPGKEPGLMLAEERTRSAGSAVTRANRPPEETIPPAPAPNDPLRDDPPFGSGCEQPGTTERCDPVIVEPTPPPPPKDCRSPLVECECDHDPFRDCDGNPRTPVGLPPVVVDETEEPPVEETEEPPVEEPVVPVTETTPDE